MTFFFLFACSSNSLTLNHALNTFAFTNAKQELSYVRRTREAYCYMRLHLGLVQCPRLWWPSMTEPINCQLLLQPPRQSSSRSCPLALSIGAHLRTEIGAVQEAPSKGFSRLSLLQLLRGLLHSICAESEGPL